MKKAFITILLVFSLLIMASVACSEDYSSLTVEQLSEMRDAINKEINSRLQDPSSSLFVIDNEYFTMTITDFYETDKAGVNDLYDQYKPGTGASDEAPRMIILFTFENKSDVDLSGSILSRDACINGWVTSAYCGLKNVPAHRKAKGFINVLLQDCEAESIDQVNSCELSFDIRDVDYNKLIQQKFVFIHADSGWIME